MALSNALFAGLSGLDVNQVKLNIVGNNIANANTVAFKSTRVLFKPQFYVTDSGGSQPDGDSGGTNPSQRGLGVVISALEKNFQPGSIETTGRPTDMAIDGDGFFIVRSDEQKYTRDGSFRLNANNQLVTSAGDLVQGYGVDQSFQIITGQLTDLTIPLGAATTAQATSVATMEGNLNAAGTVASGASILASQYLTVLNSGTAPSNVTLLTDLASASDITTPLFNAGDTLTLSARKGSRSIAEATLNVTGRTLGDLMNFLRQALGINDTVVPAAGQAAPGVVLEADPANAANQRIVITGNSGADNALELGPGSLRTATGLMPLRFADATDANGIASNPSGESVHTSLVVYDSLGAAVTLNVTAVLERTSSTGNVWRFYAESASDTDLDLVVGTGTLTFDNFGKLRAVTGNTITIDRTDTGAQTPLTLTLDFSRMTSLAHRSSELAMVNQDGSPMGRLTGFSVGADGRITGSFSNGVTRTLGQLAIATFTNPAGLIDRGGNMYVEGANSGTAVIGVPATLGAGKIVAGALELSNVDLSEEFINLIIASTGFAASSRVISTSDQLLTELLNANR